MLTFDLDVENVNLPHCFGNFDFYEDVCHNCGFSKSCRFRRKYGDKDKKGD